MIPYFWQLAFNPKFNNVPNNLPPPHPYPNGNKNHQYITDGSRNTHPYAGPFLPKKFSNGSNSSGTPLSMDSDPPSVLLSTATPEDDTSNQERPSRWSRHRGRTTRKRSPSARQRASASVIRQQDCSPKNYEQSWKTQCSMSGIKHGPASLNVECTTWTQITWMKINEFNIKHRPRP